MLIMAAIEKADMLSRFFFCNYREAKGVNSRRIFPGVSIYRPENEMNNIAPAINALDKYKGNRMNILSNSQRLL